MNRNLISVRRLASISLIFFTCAVATAALASVDTSPSPGGAYKLKPGIYVAETESCERPSNSAVRKYDGRAIAALDSRACKVLVISRKQNRMIVDQSCIDDAKRPIRRKTERQQIVVRNALTFTQKIRGHTIGYRYCPAYQLPERLQK